MRYVAFWEMDPNDMAKVIAKFSKRDSRPNIGDFKTVFGPVSYGGGPKGFTVFETDNLDALVNYTNYYIPELKMTIYPCHDSSFTAQNWVKYYK